MILVTGTTNPWLVYYYNEPRGLFIPSGTRGCGPLAELGIEQNADAAFERCAGEREVSRQLDEAERAVQIDAGRLRAFEK